MRRANYSIVKDVAGEPLVIRDDGGPVPSVTNAAEDVVKELLRLEKLPPGRRLLYYDSDDQLDEILVKHGKFVGFAPGPRGDWK